MNGGQYLEVQVAYALGFKGEPNTSGVKYENDRSDEMLESKRSSPSNPR